MKKKISILGGGESGVGAAILASRKGFDVFLSDKGKIKDQYKKELKENNIDFEEGLHSSDRIFPADEIVKSPGIPFTADIVKSALGKNIPVVDEIELAARFSNAKLVGITGTNGKTTTTLLVYHILQKAGLDVGLAGNIGKSMARQVAHRDPEYFVLELSSFQLDGLQKARLEVAILLNITPDHLDRYEYDFSKYIKSKFGIVKNQKPEDAFVFCLDDPGINEGLKSAVIPSRMIPFSIKETVKEGAFLSDNQIHININQNNQTMFLEELALQGKHNLYNSMAAGIAGRLLDIRKSTIRESLSDFQNAEHRLEHVATVHGITFINDSKATNVNSTWYALESMQTPVVWIVGGVDKGNDYELLRDLVKEKVKAIVCLGKDNKKIIKAFKGVVPVIVETDSAKEAVKKSYSLAKKGETVLLSPCCASFDLFENFEDRGHQFKMAVKAL
jgi:UDP-N-acetylmuramoylalanine--D-glutamate ligase